MLYGKCLAERLGVVDPGKPWEADRPSRRPDPPHGVRVPREHLLHQREVAEHEPAVALEEQIVMPERELRQELAWRARTDRGVELEVDDRAMLTSQPRRSPGRPSAFDGAPSERARS